MVFPTTEIETVTFAPFVASDLEKDILKAPVESTTPIPVNDATTPAAVVVDNAQTLPVYANPFLVSMLKISFYVTHEQAKIKLECLYLASLFSKIM
jgi:hypothetical protein